MMHTAGPLRQLPGAMQLRRHPHLRIFRLTKLLHHIHRRIRIHQQRMLRALTPMHPGPTDQLHRHLIAFEQAVQRGNG